MSLKKIINSHLFTPPARHINTLQAYRMNRNTNFLFTDSKVPIYQLNFHCTTKNKSVDKNLHINIIYFHGNSSDVYSTTDQLNILGESLIKQISNTENINFSNVYISIISYEYPGYFSTGGPFDVQISSINKNLIGDWCEHIASDFNNKNALNALNSTYYNILYGYSIGCGFATITMKHVIQNLDLVLLEAPFSSVYNVAKEKTTESCLGSLLLSFWSNNDHEYFNNVKNIGKIPNESRRFKIFVIMGMDDEWCGGIIHQNEFVKLLDEGKIDTIHMTRNNHYQFLETNSILFTSDVIYKNIFKNNENNKIHKF